MTKTPSSEQTTIVNGVPCFTTKSGIKIGCMYDPPLPNYMSREAEFWQRRLLKPSVAPLPYTREQLDDVMQTLAGIALGFSILIVFLT